MDTVCIGMMSPQEAREDIGLARSILEGLKVQHELQYTRSKQTLAATASATKVASVSKAH